MNLRDIAKKVGSYISSKTQDDEGWIRQGNFAPKQQVQQMGQNLSAWGNIANQGIKNQIDIQKRDFNQYLWKPLKENPVLTPTLNRFEQATPAIGNQLRQLNPFSPKQTPQQNWQDTKKIGAAALTAYGLAKAPLSAVLGGAIISPLIKLGTNVYENKKGADLNKQLSQYGQSRTDIPLFAQPKPYQQKKINEGVVDSISEGAGQGLANAGTTRLTNYLVQSLSKTLPFLKPLTEEAIKKSAPVVTDTTKEAVKKVFDVGTKRLVKAAVIETAVESPIWATFTQTEQESYIEALTREAEENLIMNIGMAGVNTLSDSKALIPIVKKSIDTAVTNYWKNASSPEGIRKQGGFFAGPSALGFLEAQGKFSSLADKKVRFEVDDSSFKLKPVEGGYGNKTFKLDDLIEHKELFRNYPELKNVEVSFKGKGNSSIIEQGFKGSTNKNKIEIGNVNSMDEAKETLLHEIQHIIQTKEGFASGGSPAQFTVKRTPAEDIELQNLFLKESKNGLTPEEQARKQSLSGGGIDGILNKYQRLSGEIEARDVQARMNLTPEQRARTMPYSSQGIPQNEWITKFDNEQAQSILKSASEEGFDTNNLIRLSKEDRNIMGKFVELVETNRDKGNLGQLGLDADNIARGLGIDTNLGNKAIASKFNRALELADSLNIQPSYSIKPQPNIGEEDLISEARKYKNSSEFVSDKIFNSSLSGDETAFIENNFKGKTFADKLTNFYNKTVSPESKGIKQPTIKIKADSDQNLLNNQQGRLDNGKPSVFSSQGNGLRVPQSTSPTIKIKVGQPNQISSGKPPSEPIIPQTKLSDIENKVYGTETKLGNTGNKESVGFIGSKFRSAEIKANEVVSKGLTSQNKVVRGIATLFQDLFGGAGKSQEQLSQKAQFRGGTDYATKIAGDTQNYIYNLLNNDTKSLERVHAVLDPEISKIKVNEASLTANEKEALKMVREVSDFINDTNHRLGFISDELWQKNRGGKYLARAYETFDYPPEVADFIKNKSLKFDINPFKKRTEMTDWKKENAITDPAYLIGKRLQQTLFNSEVKKYIDWAIKSGLISDTQKAGYVQLSDSKAYGEAAGKWIRKDALEDIKGFFVSNDIGQKAYDILNWYDRNPLRRGQKMLKTVFNPAVRLGNRTGNYVFAWLNGINPATFAKNRSWAKNAINSNDPIYRYAIQNGITGSDITKADITRISAELKRGVNDINTLQKINAWAKESYGRVDDVSKVAAFKTWLDRGVSPQEALNRTRRGFQDYNMVGMLYDLGAKIPILGNPFVRFASESIRIVKNAAVDHPLRLVATLGAWKLFTDVMSRMSGEDEKDRKTRESRVGASHLPFTNISTNVMTPYGEVNASRLLGFSSTFTPEDTGKLGTLGTDISKYAPIQNPLDARNYTNDPIIGPVISLATDKDFRGKSIADPKQNKYTGSLLTPGEQNMNRLGYAARSYLPPSFTDMYNIGAAIQGKENVYGQVKTPLQAILRTYPGIKVEQFGPEEVQKIRDKDAEYQQYKNESLDKQIISVLKQEVKGDITAEQSAKRIQNLEKQKKDVVIEKTKTMDEKKKDIAVDLGREKVRETGEITEVQGVVLYPDKQLDTETGEYKTVVKSIDINKPITKPKITGNTEVDKKLISAYNSKITSRISDIVKLVELEKLDATTAEKMISELKKAKSSSTGTGKSKKIKVTFKAAKYDIPKINIKFKKPTASTIKLKSAPKIKVSSSNQRRYTIKA